MIGAGVAGIYALHRLRNLGVDALVIEAGDDLGGTWYWNRYPGCRFDSESYSYGYSFSKELLDEWHWKERFSPQPENLKYLQYVVEKFAPRWHALQHTVGKAVWDDEANRWTLHLGGGEVMTCDLLLPAIGLSRPRHASEIRGSARLHRTVVSHLSLAERAN